jgi:hypothetical protein
MSGSPKRSVQEVKDAIVASLDIARFYEDFLSGRSRLVQETADGWSNRALCPIHGDQKTPNFFVNLRDGHFKCHACGKGGSIFDFYIDMHHLDRNNVQHFADALLAVARIANFDIDAFKKTGQQSVAAGGLSSRKSQTANEPEDFLNPPNKADEHDRTNEPIDPKVIEAFQKALLPEHIKYLNEQRGLTKRTIEGESLGWNNGPGSDVRDKDTDEWFKGRYTIPVPDREKKFRNIRQYSPRAKPDFKMTNYVVDKKKATEKKYGKPARLLGLHKLLRGGVENVVICEGEFDYLLLNQMFEDGGYNTWVAVTGTHGANTFNQEWIVPMFGKNVYFLLDCDEAGKLAAAEHVNKYFVRAMNARKFTSLRIATLPLEGTKESKDITDYFMKSQLTLDGLVRILLETPEVILGGIENDEASLEPLEVSDFVSAIKDRRYIDQRITVPLTISGVSTRIYHAIHKYNIKCEEEDCCSANRGERIIPYGHSLFIEACNRPEFEIIKSIACMACEKRASPTIKVTKKVVMEEYFAHQVVVRWRATENEEGKFENTQELVQASIYVLQPTERIDIEPQNYKATGWIRTHPRTCMATFFVETLVPLEEDWKKFDIRNRENQELIQYLRKEFTVRQLLDEITHGVTKIYEADEILYAVLLTYLCPLQFAFNGSTLRGWINTAIIGDSGTGKSATYVRFSDWIELGDLFSALSGSRTGLLYAIKQKAGEWQVSIGRYVQAHRKIIAVDETQEMAAEEIKRMAVAMETGYLKVDRVASGGYNTRTRTVFLMNPKLRDGKAATISDFANGCEALRMCFDPMFIRRLDLAIFTTGKDKYEFYNQRVKLSTRKSNESQGVQAMRLTPKMMKVLIYWAWTRKLSQIQWQDDAVDHCLKRATELSRIFGDADQIPLVNPQDFRENLARLSTAFAVLDRSFTDDLESVVIKPSHVEAMARLVEIVYTSPACNLKQQSQQARSKNSLDDFDRIKKSFEEVIDQMTASRNPYYRNCNPFLQLVLIVHQVGTVRQNDLADQIGVTRQWAQRRLAILQSLNLLEVTRFGYKATRKFNLFMRRWQEDSKIERMLANIQEQIGKHVLSQDDAPIEDEAPPTHSEAVGYRDDPFSQLRR